MGSVTHAAESHSSSRRHTGGWGVLWSWIWPLWTLSSGGSMNYQRGQQTWGKGKAMLPTPSPCFCPTEN